MVKNRQSLKESRSVISFVRTARIRMAVFFIAVSFAVLFAQTVPFQPDSTTAADLWRINSSTELYVGASFYYMNPDDSIIVWCDTSESSQMGELYVMVPGYGDSALFLFTNRQQGMRINVTEALGTAVPIRTEIFFMYRFTVNDTVTFTRFTGQNRPGIDPTNQTAYPGADFVTQDIAARPNDKKYGHRWAVAGRIRDASGIPNDTLVFGFEDGNYMLTNDTVVADFDFNDVIFRVTGLYLNVELFPDSLALDLSSNNPRAGDTVRCNAVVWADSAGTRKRSPQFDSLIRWQLFGAGINRDTLIVATSDDTTALFIGKTAGAVCSIRAWFISPLTGDTISFTRSVSVRAGPAASLSIELHADTASPGFSRNRSVPAEQIQIASNQISRSVYALFRDTYGNFSGFSQLTLWDTLTLQGVPGMVSGIAIVQPGDTSRGEGIISKTGGSGDIYVVARDTVGAITLSDTLRVNIIAASYDSLRLSTVSGTDTVSVTELQLSTDQCTTLIAQGRRIDNPLLWEAVDVQWDFSFPWSGADVSTPQSRLQFCPTDTGGGTLTIAYSAFVARTIPVRAVAGVPVQLVLYRKQAQLPADTTARAARPFDLSAHLLDRRGVWRSEVALLSAATPLTWEIFETATLADTLDSTGSIVNRFFFDAVYLPLKAHRTVSIVAAWKGLADTCRLTVLPGPAYRLYIEPHADWKQSPHRPNPIDTIEIPDTRTSADVYALLRDSLGNYVDSLRAGQWGSTDTIVSVTSETPACRGTIVKNMAAREGLTRVFVTASEGGFADSLWVRLLPYHYIRLRIAAGNGTPIDSLVCSTNDDTTIIMQGLRSDTALWREVDGIWSISPSIQLSSAPPGAAARYTFFPQKSCQGWIAAALKADGLTDTLGVRFVRGKPLRVSIQLLDPANARAGDTLQAVVRIFNRPGLVEGRYCFPGESSPDSVFYLDSLGNGGRNLKPQVIIDNRAARIVTPEDAGNGSLQCFDDGVDTISILLYYAPAAEDSLHRIRFLAGELTAATAPFRLLPGPMTSIRIIHNRSTSPTDTLYLQAPQDSALLSTIGYDRYGNACGAVSSIWSTTGSLHALASAGPISRILYTTVQVIDDERGAIQASAVTDTSLHASLQVRIRGPLATIVSAMTRDTNGNGLLDRIDLTFSLPVEIRNSEAIAGNCTVTFGGNTVTVDRVVMGANDNEVRLLLREEQTGDPQTGWTPMVTLLNRSYPLDGAVDSVTVTCADGAGPVLWLVTKTLIDADNRSSDRVTVVFSEKVYGDNGQQLSLSQSPEKLFDVWVRKGTAFERVPLLDDINSLYSIPTPDTLVFIMKNGNDLTNQHYFSIHCDSGSARQVPVVDITGGNRPPRNNHKVKVTVTGSPTGRLMVAPNPIRSTGRREAPKTFHLRHNPEAKEWVRQDGAGTVLQFKIALPNEPNVRVDGKVTIFDFAGNRVACDPASYYDVKNVFSKSARVYQNEVRKNIVPSAWTPDGSIYDYCIYWNGYTMEGFPAAPGIYRATLMIVITSSKGSETRWFSELIGVRR
ncbi:MAG: hypothetical protein JW913_09365 [Chitinispirillaceae bacterium]|nr:hypothetical protein [Chitinispirillaceae bacterium]